MQYGRGDIRGELCNPLNAAVGEFLFDLVPVSLFELVRCVLHEQREDVLPFRGQRGVDRTGDRHFDDRLL